MTDPTPDDRAERAFRTAFCCMRPYQFGEVSARTMERGAIRETSPAVRYFTEGMDSTAPFEASLSACSTTNGAFSHVMRGRPSIRIDARSWNSVWTNPGSSAVAVTPVPCSSMARDSVNTVTQLLEAA